MKLLGRRIEEEKVHDLEEKEENGMKVKSFGTAEGDELVNLKNFDLDEVVQGYVEGSKKRKRNAKISATKKRKRSAPIKQTAMTNQERKKIERKVKSLPVNVLEHIFSFLDWVDLGRAMLVCQRWSEVGGHPSLWSNFPLHLSVQRMKDYAKIQRLAWVKSLTITFEQGFDFEECAAVIQPVIEPFNRAEELFVHGNVDENGEQALPRGPFFALLAATMSADSNRLARVCISEISSKVRENIYFLSSCDSDTNAFIKKTMVQTMVQKGNGKKNDFITINGLSSVSLSYEVLETIFTMSEDFIYFTTSLMIDKNIDTTKLKDLLKHHGASTFDMERVETQDVAPVNAILDLLDGQSCDLEEGHVGHDQMFTKLMLTKELLLKSHWVERLGGRRKVDDIEDEDDSIVVLHDHEFGLRLKTSNPGASEDEEESEDEMESSDDDDQEDVNEDDHGGEDGDQEKEEDQDNNKDNKNLN